MASPHLRTLIQHLRRSVSPQGDTSLTDAQLLQRWVRQRDEAAFEVLLWRHGPMVLSVCRRMLRDSHDVEDAFQAAFLTLVRKGASIRRPQALAGWLYRVAYRIALRLRSESAERTRREQSDIETLTSFRGEERAADDLREVLDEEIDALPERYRQAFVLCYLQGKTHAEAGRLLGKPTGTISCWLKRGRELMRCRLTQRGIATTAIAALGESNGSAALSAALVQSTRRAASVFAAGEESATAVISARVAKLVEGAVKGMTATKVQWTLVLGLMLSLAASGAGMWGYQPEPPAKPQAEAEAPKQSQQQEKEVARTDRFGDPLPEGAVARLGTVRQRAVDAEAAITPDGKTIVTLNKGWSVLVKFFDAASGKLQRRWALPKEHVDVDGRAFLSPNGRLLAVQESDSSPLDIWDVSSGKRQRRFQFRQEQKICRAVFSPDGKTLAVEVSDKQGENGLFLLWDIASGGQRELKGHFDRSGHLAFSADGKLLAAEAGPHIFCWNVEKGEELWRVSSEGYDYFLAFTPDGRTLIAAPDSRYARPRELRGPCTWLAWDVATGKPAAGWKLPKEYVADDTEFAVAADNRTLVFVPFAEEDDREGMDDSVRLWDSRTGRSLHTLTLAGKDGRISKKIGIRIGPFFPDGKSFLTNNGVLQRWELATGRRLPPDAETLGHRAEVIGMAYSPDGRRLATASYDCTIRLWDVATGRRLHVIRLRKGEARYLTAARYLAFTPDGTRLVSGLENDEVYVWNVETGKEVQHIKLSREISPCFRSMRLSADGRTIIVAGRGPSLADKEKNVVILARWDLATGQRKSRVELKEQMSYDDFSSDGRLIAVEDRSSGDTTLLDTSTMKDRVKLEGKWGSRYAFSADGRLVAGILTRHYPEGDKIDWDAEDYEIVVWDTKTGRGLRRIPHAFSGGLLLAFSPDGRYLAIAGMREIRIWDLSTEKVVLRHTAHEPLISEDTCSFASCLSFSPDGRTLATGHPDSTILIWNAVPSKSAASSEPRP